MTRSPLQLRTEAAWHESGHATAGHILGRRINRAWIWSEEHLAAREDVEDADVSGSVIFEPADLLTLSDAIDEIVIDFAGTAASRIAWAAGFLEAEDVGLPEKELSDDELLVLTEGVSLPQNRVALALHLLPPTGDRAHAEELGQKWTGDPLEAEELLRFCRRRTANLVGTERFQRLAVIMAGALQEFGTMDGQHVHSVLERADVIIENNRAREAPWQS